MSAEEDPLLRRGLDAYLACRGPDCMPCGLPPLPYDFERFKAGCWHLQVGVELVTGDLQDLTNVLNNWWTLLAKWHAWNSALQQFSEHDAWVLRGEFLESAVHQCLFCPSALRDAIVHVATQGIHQARLAIGKGYRDQIPGDPLQPDQEPRRYPRRKREERLRELLSPWQAGAHLLDRLAGLDDEDYRKRTLDYRNEHSHAIGPRLGLGLTRMLTRSVNQATELIEQESGRFELIDIPGKAQVSYGFGGRRPLDLAGSYAANLLQYQRARECFEAYVGILDAALKQMPRRTSLP
jgi:hypothetical protein